VPWLRRLVAGLSPRRPGFDPGPVHVGFVVDKVALVQVFTRVCRFSPVSFIPPVLYYKVKRKKRIIIITGLHNKPQGCGASVTSAAGPFKKSCNTFQALRYTSYRGTFCLWLFGTKVVGSVRFLLISAHLYTKLISNWAVFFLKVAFPLSWYETQGRSH
jgi:hypothetical protein